MKLNKLVVGIGLVLSLTVTSQLYAKSSAADLKKAASAIAAAKSAVAGANKVGFEWRDSGKMIKKAEQAAAEGNADKAISLAQTAQFQGEAGQAQALAQSSPAPRFDEIITNLRIFSQEIKMAKSAQTVAANAGFEWKHTGKIIKQAQAVADGGDLAKAIKLAAKAKHQGEAAQEQAIAQAQAGPRF
jgi:hypothetical protein